MGIGPALRTRGTRDVELRLLLETNGLPNRKTMTWALSIDFEFIRSMFMRRSESERYVMCAMMILARHQAKET